MKIRVSVLVAIVAVVVILAAPASASALLTNDYGMSFAGQASCVQANCHNNYGYDKTVHSTFATLTPLPVSATMWPAGNPAIGLIVQTSDIAFSLGAGSGQVEYLKWTPANSATPTGPIEMLEELEWNPKSPTFWEFPGNKGLYTAEYTCGACHQVGFQRKGYKPAAGNGSAATTATRNGWAVDSADDRAVKATWGKGSSIQCERCHGTGLVDNGTNGHYTTGVKIVGGWSSERYGQVVSKNILDSGVCGQCHGTFKAGIGAGMSATPYGYTPDQRITDFVTPLGFADVPEAASFEASSGYRAKYKFYPGGQDKGMKHVYFAEWTLTAHSYRPALTSVTPGASMYQKAGKGTFKSSESVVCNRCHTAEGFLKRKGAWIMSDWTESTATAGNYGQECATCHYAHKSDGSGMSVREPDAAGIGSAAGKTKGNLSICEDCHNWRVEITGNEVVPTTTGEGVVFPQREVVHGTGMFDVPEAGEFMEDVKCEECHMAATRSDYPSITNLPRYADQSWKRYSHSMNPMLPGNAKKWLVPAWGDSCSPCHGLKSQDQLQADIEGWKTDVKAAADDASAAITAASALSEAGTAAGAELLGRAYVNVKFFENDGSGGVHNPPYLTAGLNKAEVMAKSVGGSFKVLSTPSSAIAAGHVAAVAGTLEMGDGSAGAAQAVVLERLSGGAWVSAGSANSDVNGNFAFMVAPSATSTYRVRWDRSSAPTTFIYTAPFTVLVTASAPSSSITIATSATSVAFGRTFVLSGVVNPTALGGKLMHVDVKKPGKTYWSYSSARGITASSPATWWYRYNPNLRGTYRFHAIYDGDASYQRSISRDVAVTVR